MKPTMRVLVLFLAFLISACNSVQETQDKSHGAGNQYNAHYNDLVTTVKAKPSLAAITELRQIYVLTDIYKTNSTNEKTLNQSVFKAMADDNWSVCLEKANEALELNYISLNSQYGAMVCSLESGNKEQGQYHETVLNALLEAIWATGDGELIATAFFSTSTAEIDAFIGFHGLEIVSRSLMQSNEKSYDVMTIRDPKNGEQFEWYFDSSAQASIAIDID